MSVIERLRDDAHYYGKFGKQYLSNSDIDIILNNPRQYGLPRETTVPMVLGKYFHVSMIEQDKLGDFQVYEGASRVNKGYKELVGDSDIPIMLQKEKDQMDFCISEMRRNQEFMDLIYAEGNLFEEPAIKDIGGVLWKGKADIVHADFVLDIKTTSDIRAFGRYSAKKYNYDSQAFIYQELFGKPMKFLVVDKTTGELGIFDVTEEFLDGGEAKVYRAIEAYKRFFAKGAKESIMDYVIRENLFL